MTQTVAGTGLLPIDSYCVLFHFKVYMNLNAFVWDCMGTYQAFMPTRVLWHNCFFLIMFVKGNLAKDPDSKMDVGV